MLDCKHLLIHFELIINFYHLFDNYEHLRVLDIELLHE